MLCGMEVEFCKMEVGLIIQGNQLWDFLESASGSCVLHALGGSVLPHVPRQFPGAFQDTYHAPWAATTGEGKMKGAFFLPRVSPTSILQKSTSNAKSVEMIRAYGE
jgi:hypothetical protein